MGSHFNLLWGSIQLAVQPAHIPDTPQASLYPQSQKPETIAPLNKHLAEKIINAYGETLRTINEKYRKQMDRLLSQFENDIDVDLDFIQNSVERKMPPGMLPYPKRVIREAIHFILKYEKEPANIDLLRSGLDYLSYFK
ncbi:MAG: hypothetical protein HKM93_16445 [Desulfobacteraceae bacterium]|nr:hypothetical protein [Desulfobacteraceae bacterium]